jgi:myo-inositol 2-dehydrogenase/D-chiro-inositol 1-dehydrogenase
MRVAVLGTGRMAVRRAELLARHPDVAGVTIAGSDRQRTADVAAACGAHPSTVPDALARSPDAVVIASATADHARHLRDCAALGVPVFCEKPLALEVHEARSLIEALDAAAVTVQMGFQRRFDPALRAAREQAASGRLGTLCSVRITARDAAPPPERFIGRSGGIFRDMHVHDADLARWVTGREVAAVYATGAVRVHERFARHGDVDTSAILMTMDDGLPVLIDGSRQDPRGYDVRLEVLGSRDAVVAGLDERTPLRSLEPSGVRPRPAPWTSFLERFAGAFAAETGAFVALVRDGGDSPCPPRDALAALEVAVACERSRTEGIAVEPASV